MWISPQDRHPCTWPPSSAGSAHLDRTHRAALDPPEMAVTGTPVCFAVAAEDIRHLQSRRHGEASSAWRHHVQLQAVKRTLRLPNETVRNFCVARCARQIVMPEQYLDDANISPALQKMSSEAVS